MKAYYSSVINTELDCMFVITGSKTTDWKSLWDAGEYVWTSVWYAGEIIWRVTSQYLRTSMKTQVSKLHFHIWLIDDYHYVFLSLSQYVSQENPDDDYFFTEEKMYWTPSEDTTVLYQQLAQKKYREIIRQQIQLVNLFLGLNLLLRWQMHF